MEKLTQPQSHKKKVNWPRLLKKQFIFSMKLYFEPLVLFWKYLNKPHDKILVDDDD